MIDFHCHVLPAVDDGSSGVDESLKMLDELSRQGVHTVVATPHYIANNEAVEGFIERRRLSYETLKIRMNDSHPHIRLGAEVEFYDGISNLTDLKKLCIEGTDIILLEMPNVKWTKYTVDELYRLVSHGGFRIMLAHIERCLFMQDRQVVEHLLENDVIMQSNASFFCSAFTRRRACRLMAGNVIHALGSDSHNMTTRPPKLSEATSYIRKKLGDEFLEYFISSSAEIIKQW